MLFISKAFQSFVYRSKITTPRNYEIHIVLQGHSVVSWDFKLLQRFKISWGGGGLPYKRLMGMCRWMGSHFHDWIDYNGVAFFSIESLEWGFTFSDFLDKIVLHIYGYQTYQNVCTVDEK